ncbi:MAG: hypothetical protein J5930_10435 [Treponema sp.]|nr:hypothetical protein [Treponema sp.]
MGRFAKAAALASCVFSFLLTDCSNTVNSISHVNTVVVIDYASETAAPSMRLSLFAETTGDERQVESIRAVHNTSGLEWTCRHPKKITSQNNVLWTGYTNFVPPSGSPLPQGWYSLYYVDAAGEECSGSFSISYDAKILETPPSQIPALLPAAEAYVALYDEQGIMIFYGLRPEHWKTNADISAEYGLARKMRVCCRANNGTVVCMLPETNLTDEE